MPYTTIKKPSDYFNTKLYTGNGSTNAITGVGFQPDFTWIKDRTNAYGHDLYDVIRGATNRIQSNDAAGESSASGLTSFDSDGFTLGSYIGDNTNTANYASWNWLASNTTALNTDGSITSTVSANTTSGFSIVKYTGTGSNLTFGHGLGVVPSFIIIKDLTTGQTWRVYHKSLGFSKRLVLSETGAESTSAVGLSGDPTSSFIQLDNSTGCTNANGSNYIAYCFAEVKGFSKFGSYVGNGSSDGTFIYTGFKPAFVITKKSNNIENWYTFDNQRDTFNLVDDALTPNRNNAEISNWGVGFDFCSNGFKARATDGAINASGDTYIYMAFAEEPLVGDNPATAR